MKTQIKLLIIFLTTVLVYGKLSAQMVININSLSAISNNNEVDVLKLQGAINNGKTVFFPKGYYVFKKAINIINSAISITGESGTNFIYIPTEKKFENKTAALFNVRNSKSIRFTNINFKFDDSFFSNIQIKYFIFANIISSDNINMSSITTMNAGLLITTPNSTNYATANLSTNVLIDGCIMTGNDTCYKRGTVGVTLLYTNNWKINKSTIKNLWHGIQFWGGDSNPERDGNISNIRKCSNGIVDDCIVQNINQGGIWGSMGNNILVKNCLVENCGDVGIDFEGCFSSEAINNKTFNCRNGGLATFYFCNNIQFLNNKATSTDSSYLVACIYNSTQTPNNKYVKFEHNFFNTAYGIGVFAQRGATDSLIIVNNQFNNTRLSLTSNNNRIINCVNNSFLINNKQSKKTLSIPIVQLGNTNYNGKVYLTANSITLKNQTVSNDFYPFSIVQSDFNSSPYNYISNNSCIGYNKSLVQVNYLGKNKGTNNYVIVSGGDNVKVFDKDVAKSVIIQK